MSDAEFDAVASTYQAQHASATWMSGEETAFFAEYKADDARQIAETLGCTPAAILDFGSGIGNALGPLRQNFPGAAITALDVSAQSLDLARERHGDGIDYRCYDGETVPEDIGRFDLIFTACVFHHIPAGQHVALLDQLRRLLRPGGFMILFEHNPWNPLTRWSVNSCPFDENAVLISAPAMRKRFARAGFTRTEQRYRLFFPGPLAALRRFERYLAGLPMGAQYSIVAS